MNLEWIEGSGEGTVHTFAVQHLAFGPWAEQTPFVTAYIDLNAVRAGLVGRRRHHHPHRQQQHISNTNPRHRRNRSTGTQPSTISTPQGLPPNILDEIPKEHPREHRRETPQRGVWTPPD